MNTLNDIFQFLLIEAVKICECNDFENKSYKRTTIADIARGLLLKSSKDCLAANQLLRLNYLPQSIILIRCAYEAMLLMQYIKLYPNKKESFLCHSDISYFKAAKYWLTFDVFKNSAVFKEHIKIMQDSIEKEIAGNIGIDSDLIKIFKKENDRPPPGFKDIKDLFRCIKEKSPSDEFINSDVIRFNIYRNGSFLVHPNWNFILTYFLKIKDTKAIITETHIAWATYMICATNIKLLYELHLIKVRKYNILTIKVEDAYKMLNIIFPI